MSRPRGQKNLYPGVEDQRHYLKMLRHAADRGSTAAQGQLLMLAELRKSLRRKSREAD